MPRRLRKNDTVKIKPRHGHSISLPYNLQRELKALNIPLKEAQFRITDIIMSCNPPRGKEGCSHGRDTCPGGKVILKNRQTGKVGDKAKCFGFGGSYLFELVSPSALPVCQRPTNLTVEHTCWQPKRKSNDKH